MFLPGHVEKWIVLANINQFSLKKLPVAFFKYIAKELQGNYIDCIEAQYIVNLTWAQNLVVKAL